MKEAPLFWQEAFWKANNTARGRCFQAQALSGEWIFFVQSDGSARVPGPATFGGWFSSRAPNTNVDLLSLLYLELFQVVPVQKWTVSLPPLHYLPNVFRPQVHALTQLAQSVIVETNSTISLAGNIQGLPRYGFSKGNWKRNRAFLDRGGIIRPARPQEISACYTLLAQNRRRRGVTLSIPEAKFHLLTNVFPSVFRVWVAELEGELLGAALTVEIDEKTTYVFLWGDSPEGRLLSVVASICRFLIDIGTAEGKTSLDLGLSSQFGVVDEGLLKFKQNLGASEYPQYKFELDSSLAIEKTKLAIVPGQIALRDF